jgi:hypothetical protein
MSLDGWGRICAAEGVGLLGDGGLEEVFFCGVLRFDFRPFVWEKFGLVEWCICRAFWDFGVIRGGKLW